MWDRTREVEKGRRFQPKLIVLQWMPLAIRECGGVILPGSGKTRGSKASPLTVDSYLSSPLS